MKQKIRRRHWLYRTCDNVNEQYMFKWNSFMQMYNIFEVIHMYFFTQSSYATLFYFLYIRATEPIVFWPLR